MSAANVTVHNAVTIRIEPSYAQGAEWYDITIIDDNGAEVEVTVFGAQGLPKIEDKS